MENDVIINVEPLLATIKEPCCICLDSDNDEPLTKPKFCSCNVQMHESCYKSMQEITKISCCICKKPVENQDILSENFDLFNLENLKNVAFFFFVLPFVFLIILPVGIVIVGVCIPLTIIIALLMKSVGIIYLFVFGIIQIIRKIKIYFI